MAFFEGLQGRHEVVTASYAGGDDALGDTSSDGAFDYSSDGVHRANDLGLELRGDVEFDLLEEVFGSTEATDDEDILEVTAISTGFAMEVCKESLLGGFCSGLEWR